MSDTLTKDQRRLLTEDERRIKDDISARGRAAYGMIRTAAEYDKTKRRLGTTLGRRLDHALGAAQLLSAVSAAAIGGNVSTGKAESSPPPGVSSLLFEDVELEDTFGLFQRRLGLMIHALEREVDASTQRTLYGERATETTEEKDQRILRDYEGYTPDEVSFMDPTLGRPRTIERVRSKHDRRPINGRLK